MNEEQKKILILENPDVYFVWERKKENGGTMTCSDSDGLTKEIASEIIIAVMRKTDLRWSELLDMSMKVD